MTDEAATEERAIEQLISRLGLRKIDEPLLTYDKSNNSSDFSDDDVRFAAKLSDLPVSLRLSLTVTFMPSGRRVGGRAIEELANSAIDSEDLEFI